MFRIVELDGGAGLSVRDLVSVTDSIAVRVHDVRI